MKLKEKLALDWAKENHLPPWTEVGTIDLSIPAFLAGFEKCREMTAEKVHDMSEDINLDDGYGPYLKVVSKVVRMMGEEEVE